MASRSRSELRRLLSENIRTDSELDAFFVDYFPNIYSKFSAGMGRTTKISELLLQVPTEVIEIALKRWNSDNAILGSGAGGKRVLSIDDIFPITGVPEHNYVAPAEAVQLEMNLPKMGEGLLVQGPSGVGKTTAVRKALEKISMAGQAIWLQGNASEDVAKLGEWIQTEVPPPGYYIVDNAHYLSRDMLGRLLRLIRLMVDRERRDLKFTLIGINQLRIALAANVADVMNRLQTVSIRRQPSRLVRELIQRGAEKANLEFIEIDTLAEAACGSFLAGQRLCRAAITVHNLSAQIDGRRISGVAPERRRVEATARQAIAQAQDELKAQFQGLLVQFACHDAVKPPRGAGLKLLWLLQHAPDGMVLLREHQYEDKNPLLTAAFSWLMESNQSRLYEQVPLLSNFIHYDRDAMVLSVEDSLLIFYLCHMNWKELARRTGHTIERWDKERGPIFSTGTKKKESPSGVVQPPTSGSPQAPSTAAAPSAVSPVTSAQSNFSVLHLSDLHFGTPEQARLWVSQLVSDMKYDLKSSGLCAIVVSGDIANFANPAEYEAARRFLLDLAGEFSLPPQRFILVPGNHDVNWERSERAYVPVRRKSYKGVLTPGQYIGEDDSPYIELRNDGDYKLRFEHWAKFYESVRGENYSLEYAEQATLHHFPDQNLLFLGLNSAWQCDHHFTGRASIYEGALADPLKTIRNNPSYAQALKIAVFHHPVINSPEDDRITDGGFLQRLAQSGFRLALHGHIHKAQVDRFMYDATVDGRRISLLGAGTFGAPTKQWVPGYPLQYQLLQFEAGRRLTVHTRRREEPSGSWKPDARWLHGADADPRPRHSVNL